MKFRKQAAERAKTEGKRFNYRESKAEANINDIAQIGYLKLMDFELEIRLNFIST